MSNTLKEAKRLYDLGFAIIWLYPNSKEPIGKGWTTGDRKPWDQLQVEYREGNNVGVRLGEPSKIGENYLAVVDVDVKSLDERHRKEAINAAKKIIKGLECPVVLSGRGNGSRHYYLVSREPFKTYNAAESAEIVKYHAPSKKKISKNEKEKLTDEEIKTGIRLARAWEVSLYSSGRQVVLPPSIHPDSGKLYHWRNAPESGESFNLFEPAGSDRSEDGGRGGKSSTQRRESSEPSDFDFTQSTVVLDWLDCSDAIKDLVKTGTWRNETVTNRSDYLLVAANGLVSCGCSKDDILTILTEKDYFLGECAYEHAQTDNRKRAAKWLWNYTVKKVMEERDAKKVFLEAGEVVVAVTLSSEDAAKQQKELHDEMSKRSMLETTEKGHVKATLNNCKFILIWACGGPRFVGRNEFAANDYYLCDTPWRSRMGDAVTDADIHRIKFYCAETYGVEFGDNTVNQTLMEIADLNRFHPVRNWLRSLKWDGVPRIDTWLQTHAGAVGPDAYVREISRKMLVALVKRVMQPGCKFDYVVILEGLQGIGKSTLLKNLIGDDWFSDATLNIGDKDAVLTMQSKWLIELGELSSMRKAETESLKAFITQTTDRIRAPYGKRVEEFPRQCIFVGSTNNEEYLPDLTGNRRFWPVQVTAIEFGGVRAVREQLFAEAMQAYEWGEELYLDDSAVASLATEEQAKRQYVDEWYNDVVEIVTHADFNRHAFEIKDVASKLGVDTAKRNYGESQRISRCLIQLGFEKYRSASGGHKRRLWREKGSIGPGRTMEDHGLNRNHGPPNSSAIDEEIADFY